MIECDRALGYEQCIGETREFPNSPEQAFATPEQLASVSPNIRLTVGIPAVKIAQLDSQNCCLNFIQPAVPSLFFTEVLFGEVLSLPMYAELTGEQIEYVANTFEAAAKGGF